MQSEAVRTTVKTNVQKMATIIPTTQLVFDFRESTLTGLTGVEVESGLQAVGLLTVVSTQRVIIIHTSVKEQDRIFCVYCNTKHTSDYKLSMLHSTKVILASIKDLFKGLLQVIRSIIPDRRTQPTITK